MLLVLLLSLFLIIIIFNYFFKFGFNVIDMFLVSVVAAALELFDRKGLDNLFLPLGVSLVVYLMEVI